MVDFQYSEISTNKLRTVGPSRPVNLVDNSEPMREVHCVQRTPTQTTIQRRLDQRKIIGQIVPSTVGTRWCIYGTRGRELCQEDLPVGAVVEWVYTLGTGWNASGTEGRMFSQEKPGVVVGWLQYIEKSRMEMRCNESYTQNDACNLGGTRTIPARNRSTAQSHRSNATRNVRRTHKRENVLSPQRREEGTNSRMSERCKGRDRTRGPWIAMGERKRDAENGNGAGVSALRVPLRRIDHETECQERTTYDRIDREEARDRVTVAHRRHQNQVCKRGAGDVEKAASHKLQERPILLIRRRPMGAMEGVGVPSATMFPQCWAWSRSMRYITEDFDDEGRGWGLEMKGRQGSSRFDDKKSAPRVRPGDLRPALRRRNGNLFTRRMGSRSPSSGSALERGKVSQVPGGIRQAT
ncbi:hypothetical protein DFP72DRAFT_854842 [Ephemerocybe angulata]|uniref:Uncharacterized protein n=1 Tax=Ephemerocybe angulata TaxID=980116 RepID=A0A8H6HIU9_9AGAR|nr:hypothetical protein DFP72DRAFT_854842 [Tulosesus angulatus]